LGLVEKYDERVPGIHSINGCRMDLYKDSWKKIKYLADCGKFRNFPNSETRFASTGNGYQ
jgi:hypothetical protein